ncbi:hypothetical protein BDQ17DRAFT_1421755 [Cyathus striatus]|nr:hypothetical protein BDQ17DRAFT_1421755 [Cyathus striatus]
MQSSVKLSLVFLLASLLSATALKLHVPTPEPGSKHLKTNGTALVSWTVEKGDPEFVSIEIQNNVTLDSFEFSRNVSTAHGCVSGKLDGVPGGKTFFLQAVSPSNVTKVFATSHKFTVAGKVPSITTAAKEQATAA